MDTRRHSRFFLFLQLLGTLIILFLIPNTILQTVLLLAWWGITFYPLTREEFLLVLISSIVYTGFDLLAIHFDIYQFAHHDLWQMPYYEFFMWGFYFLHTKRFLDDIQPRFKKTLWYAGYLVLVGVTVEFLGTTTGQWTYGISYFLIWWIVSWAVSGIVLAQILLPLTDRAKSWLKV